MTLKISLDFHDRSSIPISDLLGFADLIRSGGSDGTALLKVLTYDNGGEVPFAIEAEIQTPPERPPIQIDASSARAFVSTLDVILASDGDARNEFANLQRLRQALS
jgi:hypothetical protein